MRPTPEKNAASFGLASPFGDLLRWLDSFSQKGTPLSGHPQLGVWFDGLGFEPLGWETSPHPRSHLQVTCASRDRGMSWRPFLRSQRTGLCKGRCPLFEAEKGTREANHLGPEFLRCRHFEGEIPLRWLIEMGKSERNHSIPLPFGSPLYKLIQKATEELLISWLMQSSGHTRNGQRHACRVAACGHQFHIAGGFSHADADILLGWKQ